MARRKSKAAGIVLAIVLIAVLAGVIGACAYLTNGFRDEIKTLGVTVNDKLYVNNTDGLVMENKTTITVTNPFSNGYTVKIYPKAVKDDFTFTISSEEWKWSDTLAMEFTDGFVITETEKEFTVSYTNLATVIAKALTYDYGEIKVPDAPAGDLFEMRITSGNNTIAFGFTLSDLGGNVGITDIDLDTDSIIF